MTLIITDQLFYSEKVITTKILFEYFLMKNLLVL